MSDEQYTSKTERYLKSFEFMEKARRSKELQERMDSLIKTTTGLDIKCRPWAQGDIGFDLHNKEWGYIASQNVIVYPEEGQKDIRGLTDYEAISLLLEEIAFAKFSSPPQFRSYPEPRHAFIQLVNALENVRVERRLMDRFPGTYDSMKYMADWTEKNLSEEDMLNVPDYINFIYNVLRSEWGFEPKLKDRVKETFLNTKDVIEEAFEAQSTNDMINNVLINKLWPKFVPLTEEPEGNEEGNSQQESDLENESQKKESDFGQVNQDANSDSTEGPKGNGSGDESVDSDGNNNGDKQQDQEDNQSEDQQGNSGQQSSSNGSAGGGNQTPQKKPQMPKLTEQEINKLKSSSSLRNILNDKAKKNAEKSGATLKQQEIKKPTHSKAQQEEEEQKTMKASLKDLDDLNNAKSRSDFVHYEQLFAEILPYLHYFCTKMNSVMKDNANKRQGGSYKSGKLNSSSLWKVATGNERIFSRPILRLHKDYAVSLVIDESGSMAGSKIRNAALSAVLMAEVLHRINVPFEIIGFNETVRQYKSIEQPFNWGVKRNMENIIPSANGRWAGSTNDAYAVNLAASQLNKRQPSERIMIVVSDGSPNPSGNNIPTWDQARFKRPMGKKRFLKMNDFELHYEVALAERQGILTVGVGIESNSVEEYYKNHLVIKQIEQLPKTILTILKRNIRRG